MSKNLLLVTEEGLEFENILPKIKCKLCILIFGCVVIDKYKEDIDGIVNTWGTKCDDFQVPYFIFVGKNVKEYENNEHVVTLDNKGVEDDYKSASYKQYLGIEWILSRYDPEFLYIAGSDVYVNVEEMLKVINNYNSSSAFFIGNGLYVCQILEYNIHIHPGGAGIILSRKTMEILKPYLYKFQERWNKVIKQYYSYDENACKLYTSACDVSLALMCYLKGVSLSIEPRMFHHKDMGADFNNFISIHQMRKPDMLKIFKK
jgi:hypothetical protein